MKIHQFIILFINQYFNFTLNIQRSFTFLLKQFLLFTAVTIAFSSCISHKQLLILNEGDPYIDDSTAVIDNLPEPIIQTDDRLFIRVSAFDDETAAPFMQSFGFGGQNQGGGNNQNNMMGGMGMFGGNNQNNPMQQLMIGYLVDDEGNIEYPVVGTVNLEGLTIAEASKKMYSILDEYLVNYSVDVQFMNRRVTVSGEVVMPGLVQLDRNRISIIEAIQRAGGITPFSNTDEVYVIREIEGERIFGKVSLKDRDIVNSQFYYVYPNDVIYLQPIKAKTFNTQSSFFSVTNIITSLISAAALIFALTR